MESLNREQIRKVIGKFYKENYYAGKVYTFKHFSAMGLQKSLIYRVMQRYEEGRDAKHKSGAGRPSQKFPPKPAKRLVTVATGRVGVSQRKLALKFHVSQPYVNKVLAKHDVKYRKRRSCPRYAPGQAERAKSGASAFRRKDFSLFKPTQIEKRIYSKRLRFFGLFFWPVF